MERSIIWFKCAAMHDPVRPVVKRPAALGWEAKERQVDLVIERPPKGEDLLKRMKGWFTADVHHVLEIVKKYGRLVVLDDYDLVVETKEKADMESLGTELQENFDKEVWIEIIEKKRI